MAKRIWLFCMALAVLGIASPTTLGKPGDLPVDITQQCPDARESVADGWTAPDGDCLAARPRAGADAAPCLRSNQPIARDNSPRPVNQARGTHHRVRREAHVPPIAPHDAEAARLLALGERCRQIGDHAQAAVCFEEAHLVSPTSIAGRLAIDRLREMELERFGGPRGAAEEAEIPAFVQPQRPVIEPRDVSGPRPPARQPGASPERQPQLPPVPTPSRPRELQKLKEMLDSTVPLGGAEEQETMFPIRLDYWSALASMPKELETIEFQPLSSPQPLSNERITIAIGRVVHCPGFVDDEDAALAVPPTFFGAADLCVPRTQRRHHLVEIPVDGPLFETAARTILLRVTIAVESSGDLRQLSGTFLQPTSASGLLNVDLPAVHVIPDALFPLRNETNRPLAGWQGKLVY